MDKQDRELEQIMLRRAVPEMRSNLSERIIEAARQNAQQQEAHMPWSKFDFAAWLGSFSRNFVLPRPAVALGLVLIAGVMLGTYVQNVSAVTEEDMIFLYVENSFEVDNWL